VVIRDLTVVGDGLGTSTGFGVLVLHRRPDAARLDRVRIEDVEARGFRWAGLYVGGVPDGLPRFRAQRRGRLRFRDVQLRRCTARENLYFGIYVDGSGKGRADDYANQDVVLVGCVAADNPGDPHFTENHSGNGILVGDTDGAVIEGCVARCNGA